MTENAYFAFWQAPPDGIVNTFSSKLTDPAKIAQARAILADTSLVRRHVHGTIRQSRVAYNPNWSLHFDPEPVGFFERQIKVCDANMARRGWWQLPPTKADDIRPFKTKAAAMTEIERRAYSQ